MERIALKVYEEYQTYDPYVIAVEMGALVAEDDLKEIHAYYAHVDDIKIICLNAGMTEQQKKFALTHCLYHVYTDRTTITVYQHREGQQSKHEQEGNLFAKIFLNRKE